MFDELIELARDLDIDYVQVSKGKRYTVEFAHRGKCAEIKEGALLVSASGVGDTLDEAAVNYLLQIRGKRLVFDAYGEHRYEVIVPV